MMFTKNGSPKCRQVGEGYDPIGKPASKFGTHIYFRSAVPYIPVSVRE